MIQIEDSYIPLTFAVVGHFNPSNPFIMSWNNKTNTLETIKPPLGTKFHDYAGVTIKNTDTMIICGGQMIKSNELSDHFCEYSFKDNKIVTMPSMLVKKSHTTIFYTDDKLYSIGGNIRLNKEYKALASCEIFNYKTGKWKQIADLNFPRINSTLLLYDNALWCLGGNDNNYSCRVIEKYNKKENRWKILDIKLPDSSILKIAPTDNPNEIFLILDKVY